MKSVWKKGRPTAFYEMADPTKVDGLSRVADGRWKVLPLEGYPKTIEFVEADERLAVAPVSCHTGGSCRKG